MVKRKREAAQVQFEVPTGKARKVDSSASNIAQSHVQIVTGSYERVLHGIVATLPTEVLHPSAPAKDGNSSEALKAPKEANAKDSLEISFADSFLFNAHASAIRCLALAPIPDPSDTTQKTLLATGSTDEKINLYNLSTVPPPVPKKGDVSLPSLSGVKVQQNMSNRELGSLLHHSSSLTALHFPNRSKLLSSAEDNTIAISRARDWTVLSTIKAPIPKAIGRPSGDTAAPGEVPAGVNDFAVHPSMKLMVSVGKGERSMRLWNLVTGKKAGVLAFERDMLQQVGEGKFGTGEGRRILWDEEGEEFAVAFERGACVFDIDCKMKAKVCPKPSSKVHQMWYVPGMGGNVLALSTEDGRILFFETETGVIPENEAADDEGKKQKKQDIPAAKLIAQLGGRALGVNSRIKDFAILAGKSDAASNFIFVTGSSDGTIRLWSLSAGELEVTTMASEGKSDKVPQVGHLLAQYDTGNRITCLKAFVMNESTDEDAGAESEAEFAGFSTAGEEASSDSDESD